MERDLEERALRVEGCFLAVLSLAVWERVISSYSDNLLQVWSLATGECKSVHEERGPISAVLGGERGQAGVGVGQ